DRPEVSLGLSLAYELSADLKEVTDVSRTTKKSSPSFQTQLALPGGASVGADYDVAVTLGFAWYISTDFAFAILVILVVDEFHFVFLTDSIGQVNAGLNLGVSRKLEGEQEFKLPLNAIKIPPITIPAPVPVVLTSDVGIESSVTVTAGLEAAGNVDV